MKKNRIVTIVAVCAAVCAAVTAAILFHEEIRDFVKKIIIRIDALRSREHYNDCCFDEAADDFDDFEDVAPRV